MSTKTKSIVRTLGKIIVAFLIYFLLVLGFTYVIVMPLVPIVKGIIGLELMLFVMMFGVPLVISFKIFLFLQDRSLKGSNDVIEKRPLNKNLETNVEIERTSQQSVETFIATLEDTSAQVRIDAVKNLGEIGNKRAVEPLLKMLDDRNKNVFIHVVIALSKIGGQKAIKGLVDILSHKGYEDIMYVITNLIGIVESHVIPLVKVYNGFTEQYKKVILQNLMSQDLEKISEDYIRKVSNKELKTVLYLKNSNKDEALAIIDSLDDSYKQAELYMYATEYIKAAEVYENANAFEKAGDLYFKLEKFKKAEQCYREVNNFEGLESVYQKTDNKPKLAELHGDYKKAGDLYFELEKYKEAEMCYQKGNNFPGLENLYQKTDNKLGLAKLYENKNDYKHAGDLYLELDDYENAILCYKKNDNVELLEKVCLKAGANLELGKLYEKQNKFVLSYQHYLKAFQSKDYDG